MLKKPASGATSHRDTSEEGFGENPLLGLEREAFSEHSEHGEEAAEHENEDAWSVVLKSTEPLGTPSTQSAQTASGEVPLESMQGMRVPGARQPLSGRDYQDALQGCLLRAAKGPKILMPWETPIMSAVFGEPEPIQLVPAEPLRQPGLLRNPPIQERQLGSFFMPTRPPRTTALGTIKNRPNLSFPKNEQALRLKGISLWCEIIWSDPHSFGIRRRLGPELSC